MINQVVLVGYIYSNEEIRQTFKFNGDCYIELNRNFQNKDGQYTKNSLKFDYGAEYMILSGVSRR